MMWQLQIPITTQRKEVTSDMNLNMAANWLSTMFRNDKTDVAIVFLFCALQCDVTMSNETISSHTPEPRNNETPTRKSSKTKIACEVQTERFEDATDARTNTRSPHKYPACESWCKDALVCTGILSSLHNSECNYSTNNSMSISLKRDSFTVRIVKRCPRHYSCESEPCKHNATCKPLNEDGTGATCVCANGWTGWFCDRRPSCKDELCRNGGTCHDSAQPNGGFNCSCGDMATGVFCETLLGVPSRGVGGRERREAVPEPFVNTIAGILVLTEKQTVPRPTPGPLTTSTPKFTGVLGWLEKLDIDEVDEMMDKADKLDDRTKKDITIAAAIVGAGIVVIFLLGICRRWRKRCKRKARKAARKRA